MTPYATVEQYREWDGLPADGSADPDDIPRGLIYASRLLDNKPQVQAKFVLENFPEIADIDPNPYTEACCAIVAYWREIGGGYRIDLSQNTLRPGRRGGWSRVGPVSLPPYEDFAPLAVEVLRAAGLWFPSPETLVEKVRRLLDQ